MLYDKRFLVNFLVVIVELEKCLLLSSSFGVRVIATH